MSEADNENHSLRLFGHDSLEIPLCAGEILDSLDQEVWDQIAQLSNRSPHFRVLTDDLLKRTSQIPKEERRDYIAEAHNLCSIIAGYEDSDYLIRNFFGYLFDKTRGMDNKSKRRFVYITKNVYDCVLEVFDDKTEHKTEPAFLASMIRPQTNLVDDLRFTRQDYDRLKDSLKVGIESEVFDEEFDHKFYRKQTVVNIIELISETNKVA